MTGHMKTTLIAPCGINCAICLAYLRERDHCPGCRAPDDGKKPSCIRCGLKTCDSVQGTGRKYCFECESFPCARLKHLDKRYLPAMASARSRIFDPSSDPASASSLQTKTRAGPVRTAAA